MAEVQSTGSRSPLQEESAASPSFLFPDDLSWFYVLRQLSRRQMVAALTFARHVERMERAMQPLIRARKRAHFMARKSRRHTERQATRPGPV